VPALRASTTRTSSGGAPYVFVTKGRLTVPAGVRRADGCTGRVSIQVKAGGRTISTRRVRVDRSCAFSGRVTFGDASRFGSERSLRFVVRFQGNTLLAPKAARVQTVRIG
jgi:hypothetical protein